MKKIVCLIIFLNTTSYLSADQFFGLNPSTIWKGGVGTDLPFSFYRFESESITDFVPRLTYGIQNDFSFNSALVIREREVDTKKNCCVIKKQKSKGVADLFLNLKYKFYNENSFGATNQASIIAGVKIPCQKDKLPAITTGAVDFLAALSAWHASIYWNGDISVEGIFTTTHNNIKIGNQFFYSASYGTRFAPVEYDRLDFMAFVEFTGLYIADTTNAGKIVENSRQHVLLGGPAAVFFKHNKAVRFIFQLPMAATNVEPKYRAGAAFSILF